MGAKLGRLTAGRAPGHAARHGSATADACRCGRRSDGASCVLVQPGDRVIRCSCEEQRSRGAELGRLQGVQPRNMPLAAHAAATIAPMALSSHVWRTLFPRACPQGAAAAAVSAAVKEAEAEQWGGWSGWSGWSGRGADGAALSTSRKRRLPPATLPPTPSTPPTPLPRRPSAVLLRRSLGRCRVLGD